jgi:DNA-binding transcriptional MerR regulator
VFIVCSEEPVASNVTAIMDKELKLYYSIREVSAELGIPEYTLRFWEKEFSSSLNPKKTAGGSRQYTTKDIELIRLIRHLVKDQGLTIKAARARLKTSKQQVVNRQDIVERLEQVRSELLTIKEKLDELALQLPIPPSASNDSRLF